jgi:hypothetical protein
MQMAQFLIIRYVDVATPRNAHVRPRTYAICRAVALKIKKLKTTLKPKELEEPLLPRNFELAL